AIAITIYYAGFQRTDLTKNSRSTRTRLLPAGRAKAFFTASLIIWLAMLLIRSLALIPGIGTFLNTIWTFGSSAGLAAMFYLFCLMGLGRLKAHESALLLASVLTGVGISFASGFLVGGAWILVVCLIAYTSGKGKLPITPALVGLLLVSFLQAGKA